MLATTRVTALFVIGLASRSARAFQSKKISFSSRRDPQVRIQMVSSVAAAPGSAGLAEQSSSYKLLLEKLNTITQLERAQAVLNYDQLVFMPEAASAQRGAQLSALAGVLHEKATDKELLPLIEDSYKCAKEGSDERRLLDLESKKLRETARVSSELAKRSAELSSRSYAAWVKAREDNDFAGYASTLKECFDTAIETAVAKRGDQTHSVYTQMLDEFETEMSQARIDEIFGSIQETLVPLIQQVKESDYKPSNRVLEGTFDIDKQRKLSHDIVTSLGFDPSKGRLDVSVHPFTSSFSSHDVRITSRFGEGEWFQGLAGSIHEGGHAMYEQNMRDSPYSIDQALSMGTHESQSLFWERHIGLSEPFWEFATSKMKESFPDTFGADCTSREIYEAVNSVTPSLIRVEADELTYPLHVILRYNIERDVVDGKLLVEDIPERWNGDMKDLLGVTVPSDQLGCLQDIHWPSLAIGYFPTYLIGSSAAAQLAHYCTEDLGDMNSLVRRGEFSRIKEWLVKKIHVHGRRYKSLDDLLEDQVGEKLNPKYFLDYLKSKYNDIYKL